MKVNIAVATVFLLASLAAGLMAAPGLGSGTLDQLRDAFGIVKDLGPAGLFLFIFLNNALKALGALLSGILLGLPSLLFLVINGWTLGLVTGSVASTAGWLTVASAVAPHGLLELAMVLVAVAFGIAIGRESLNWLLRRPSQVRATLVSSLRWYAMMVLPGLLVAAAIETFATPLLVAAVRG